MQSWVSCKSFYPLRYWVWLVSLWEMVSHPLRCDLTVVRIDVVVWAMVGMVEMVNTVKAYGARIFLGPNLRSRHPRTICVAMCLVWNDLLNNYVCNMLCVMLGWVGVAPYFVTYLSSYFVNCLNHMVQEGMFVRETLALHAGTVCLGNHSKAWHTLVVDLCNSM
jgi:hypothetical protein